MYVCIKTLLDRQLNYLSISVTSTLAAAYPNHLPQPLKMSNEDTKPYGDWNGDFTWDGHFLRMHIKTVTQKYDMEDPRTWPLVHGVVATGDGVDHRKTKLPPQYMVYDQDLIKTLNEYRPLQGSRAKSGRQRKNDATSRFLFYPFNYDRWGQLRAHPHIPPDDLEL